MSEVKANRSSRRPSFSPTPTISKRNRTPLAIVDNSGNSRQQQRQMRSKTPFRGGSKPIGFNYAKDIYEHLISRQQFVDTMFHSYVSPQTRSTIIEWLFIICHHFGTPRSVIHATIGILDRCLKSMPVEKNSFQLIGATCLFLSLKMHAPKTIPLSKIAEECANQFSTSDFLECETQILESINYDLSNPTVLDFLDLHEANLASYKSLQQIIWFISDIHLQFSAFLRFRISTISNAIVIYSLHLFGESILQPGLKSLLLHENWKELYECIEEIHGLLVSLFNKKKTCIIEKIQPEISKKMKDLIGVPSLPSIISYLSLFPEVDLDMDL